MLVAVPWASRPERASGSLLPHCGAGPTAWLLAGSPAYSRSARGQTWGPEPLWDDKWGRLSYYIQEPKKMLFNST